MGIFINLYVSNSLTKEEWVSVYEDSLKLIDVFPLAEIAKKSIRGTEIYCLIPTKERILNEENSEYGWEASDDYINLRGAESYYLYRDLIEKNKNTNEEHHDALLTVAKEQLSLTTKIDNYNCFRLFGNKTQGESYHVYLLAIACLVVDRLKDKAFVYGDITRGQCKMAISEANKVLNNHINLPVQCDTERFYARVSNLPLLEIDKIKIFEYFYLGNKDEDFGNELKKYFKEEDCMEFWESSFNSYSISQIGFDRLFQNYILWGFDIEKLCHIIKFKNNSDYEEFVKSILDAKLHIENKNITKIFELDKEKEALYGISSLISQFLLTPRGNKTIARYIPIEEIRIALKKGIGKNFEVDSYIDKYLEKEKIEMKNKFNNSNDNTENKNTTYDSRNDLEKIMTKRINDCEELKIKYNMIAPEQLLFYKSNYTIMPNLETFIKVLLAFTDKMLKEKINTQEYKNLIRKDTHALFEYLANISRRRITLRDKDWEKIYDNINQSNKTFERYYSLLHVDLSNNDVYNLVRALIINDDLYNNYHTPLNV